MAVSPRVFLFYGPDTRASLRAVTRWRDLFEKRHGSFASFRIEADELAPERFFGELDACLQGDTLFAEARLVVVRRLTQQEKGKSQPFSKALVAALEKPGRLDDDLLTIAVWEDRDLPSSHPLATFFRGQESAGRAKTYQFAMPTGSGVLKAARAILEPFGQVLAPDAARWLAEQYAWIERRERMERRLKPDDIWQDDYRAWWLTQLLEGASLRGGSVLTSQDLQAGHRDLGEPVGAFDIASALAGGNWGVARRKTAGFLRENSDPGDMFALMAAIRWQLSRHVSSRSAYGLRLLVEADVAAKNGVTDPTWLLPLLIDRLEAAHEDRELVPVRALWLSQLPRN